MSNNPEVDAAMVYAICAVIVFLVLAVSVVLNLWQHFRIRELRDKLSDTREANSNMARNAFRGVSR